MQERLNSIANSLELHLSCINPLIYSLNQELLKKFMLYRFEMWTCFDHGKTVLSSKTKVSPWIFPANVSCGPICTIKNYTCMMNSSLWIGGWKYIKMSSPKFPLQNIMISYWIFLWYYNTKKRLLKQVEVFLSVHHTNFCMGHIESQKI